MSYRCVQHERPQGFLETAEPFLAQDETVRGFVWGLARLNAAEPEAHGGTAHTWTLHDSSNEVVGAFFWSPPSRSLAITDVPADAGPALLHELGPLLVRNADPRLPGWNGPAQATATLAAAWENARDEPLEDRMNLLLYRCSRITRTLTTPGRLRVAVESDRALCTRWAEAFGIETGISAQGEPPPNVLPHLDAGRQFLWEVDGVPVAGASWSRPTPRSASIGFVYVPTEQRGNHFASAVTAGLTQHLFERERKTFTVLFTDASNATTNHLYPALGYELVTAFRDMGPAW